MSGSMYVYCGSSRFKRYFLADLFTGELVPCSERDFDDVVIKFRDLYEMKYDGNAQDFYMQGKLYARRER